jgi:phosphoribosyl-ATP pyrophosphohydrolase/phosphoribosyl-AMP cyclohydrolase/histidinol dehydrogenase
MSVYFTLASSCNLSQVANVASVSESIHPVIIPHSTRNDAEYLFQNPYQNLTIASRVVQLDLIDAFVSTIRTDRPDGLFTTVVCDEHDVCLGLVYSNQESIRAAVIEGRGIYFSRSRGGLWRKGDTSGMHQDLLCIRADCDGDALRFSVVQHGQPAAFCHLNTRTCWGAEHGIYKLQAILQDRLRSAPPGSYTKRLFDDQSFLQKKLLEEAQELMEATEPDHIAAEAADVLYFMMTRCVAGGVNLRDIEHHLDKRTLKVK